MDNTTNLSLVTLLRTLDVNLYFDLTVLLIDDDVLLQRLIFRLEFIPIGTLA